MTTTSRVTPWGWEQGDDSADQSYVTPGGWEQVVGAGSGPTNYTLTCDAGAYTLAGQNATLTLARKLALDAGAYAYAGQDAALRVDRKLALDAGAYSIAGQDASLQVERRLALDAGAYAYAGQDATLTYTPGAGAVAYTLACDAGAYVISGGDAALTHTLGGTQDTHDGYWSKQWLKLRKKPELPTIAEVVEMVREEPAIVEAVRPQVERKYPQVDYSQILANVQLQRFIAKQLIEAAQEEDDLEVLLLA
jgi:hypothetical protein